MKSFKLHMDLFFMLVESPEELTVTFFSSEQLLYVTGSSLLVPKLILLLYRIIAKGKKSSNIDQNNVSRRSAGILPLHSLKILKYSPIVF